MAKVNTSSWGDFLISEVFKTNKKGKTLQVPTGANVQKKDLVEGLIPRITVTGTNNGIYGYYEERPNDDNYRVYENFISVSFLGTVFYQKSKASLDMKVHCLKPLMHTLNAYTGKFLVTAILASLKESSYSDQLSSTVLPTLSISLPTDSQGNPDWQYMEDYMRNIETRVSCLLTNLEVAQRIQNKRIDSSKWTRFNLTDLFELYLSKGDNQAQKLDAGDIPLIATGRFNNGVCKYIDKGDGISSKFGGNVITIDMFGQPFYQRDAFYSVSHGHINILKPKFEMNEYIGLFFVTVFRALYDTKYGFYAMCTQTALKKETVILPTIGNQLDWEYMENYIRNIDNKAISSMSLLTK